MYASSAIIAASQARVSSALLDDARTATPLTGRVRSVLTYADFGSGITVHRPNGTALGTTCAAAYGESFAAGTTDGPGQFDFNQAGSSSNPLVKFFVRFLRTASPEDTACHAPKSILLPTGRISVPWPWSPSVVSIQLIQIGHVFIVALPTELTTMAGRRIREALASRLQELTSTLHLSDLWVAGTSRVVLAGLANGYADYTVTFEEYQQQRYEGGSTVYGPHSSMHTLSSSSPSATTSQRAPHRRPPTRPETSPRASRTRSLRVSSLRSRPGTRLATSSSTPPRPSQRVRRSTSPFWAVICAPTCARTTRTCALSDTMNTRCPDNGCSSRRTRIRRRGSRRTPSPRMWS